MSKTISARIDDTMHTMITDEANQEGITVNEKLKGMLNNHFNEEGKKEIPQSQNEASEEAIIKLDQKQSNQQNQIEDIHILLPKVIDLIRQTNTNIIEAVDQRLEDHESKYKHVTKCIGFNRNSS